MNNLEQSDYSSLDVFWGFPKPDGRFNNWNERKWISATAEKQKAVSQELETLKLTRRASSLYRAARLTNSSGIEFVLMSNSEFPNPIGFQEANIIVNIVPCFIPLHEQLKNNGKSDLRHAAMSKRGIFIYDGWVTIPKLDRENVEKVVMVLDQWSNMYSITAGYWCYWEPKYYFLRPYTRTYFGLLDEFSSLGTTMHLLTQLPPTDQEAINRSTAWVSLALRHDSVIDKFLLLFVSIESLITYIEKKATKDSLLARFAAEPISAEDRLQKREACIESLLNSEQPLSEVISLAYFDCIIGSKKMMEDHLNRMFRSKKFGGQLFRLKVGKKTLWELRSEIAHGSTNMLSNEEIEIIEKHTRTLEDIARQYIRTIFTRLAGDDYFKVTGPPNIILPATQAIGGTNSKYIGSTEMAEYYANVESLSSSVVRFTF